MTFRVFSICCACPPPHTPCVLVQLSGVGGEPDSFSPREQKPLLYPNGFNCQLFQNVHSFPPPRTLLILFSHLFLFFPLRLRKNATSSRMFSAAFLSCFNLHILRLCYFFIHKYLLSPCQCIS